MPIPFGRFTDSFKPKAKTEFWDKCDKQFEEKKFADSYENFFIYLRDEGSNNVSYTRAGDNLDFEFYQGSQKISGKIADNKVVAESYIASYEKPSVAFMRRLMELNYSLYYSRFCLNDNKIVIKFDSSIADGSPRKLYYAFKEVATRADKQDDLLSGDFAMLKSLGKSDVIAVPDAEKELKYKYFKKWIDDTMARIGQLNEDAISGGISYLLLNLLYKIDYFICPEGKTMNDLEKISWGYFARDNKPFLQKNRDMKIAFEKIAQVPKEKIMADIYRTVSTFGIANPTPHQGVLDLFNNNVNNIKWYVDNKYEDIAITIYEYLATYCLFSYGLQKPTAQLFDVLLNVTNQDFYIECGYTDVLYDTANKKFNTETVNNKIHNILVNAYDQFGEIGFKTDNLKYDTMISFLRTFIEEIKNLKYDNQ